MSDSPAETTPSPPAPAMPITRSLFIRSPFAARHGRARREEQRGCHAGESPEMQETTGGKGVVSRGPAQGAKNLRGCGLAARDLRIGRLLLLFVVLQPGHVDLLRLALRLLRPQPLAAVVVGAGALLGQLLRMAVEAALGFQTGLFGLLLHGDGGGSDTGAAEHDGGGQDRGEGSLEHVPFSGWGTARAFAPVSDVVPRTDRARNGSDGSPRFPRFDAAPPARGTPPGLPRPSPPAATPRSRPRRRPCA